MTEKVGVKHDNGKINWSLLPLAILEPIVRVLMFGAEKYSPNGWQTVPDGEQRYFSAMMRHIAAYQSGEAIDQDSGLPHIAHVCCNAIFLLHFYIERNK